VVNTGEKLHEIKTTLSNVLAFCEQTSERLEVNQTVPGDQIEEIVLSLDRIAKILAGLLLRDVEDAEQKVKIKRLKQCGFDNTEIAAMLGTTTNTVGVVVHALKKDKRKPKKRSAGGKR
jgi:DNA-binding NarL/FixJ family response regulator